MSTPEYDYTLAEMMCITTARYLRGQGTVFVGMGLPILAAMVTKLMHDPGIAYCTEMGSLDWRPELNDTIRPPRTVGDPVLTVGAAYVGDMLDALGTLLMGGHVDTAVLTGAQVDKYGNLNALLIGSYRNLIRRLPGSGGNTDAACLAKRTIIMMSLEPRRFAGRVDFLTSPGYIDGPGARRRAGLDAQGPNLLVSTMGVFGFDTPDGGETGSCEMVLQAVMPNVEPETVAAMIPWPLRMAKEVAEIEPPGDEELALLRRLDRDHFYLRDGRY